MIPLQELRGKEASGEPRWDDLAEWEVDLRVVRKNAAEPRWKPMLKEMKAAVKKTIQLRIGCQVS